MAAILKQNNYNNDNPMDYFTEAINNLAKAQMAYGTKIDKHIESDFKFQNVINNKLKAMDKKIDEQNKLLNKNSVYLEYIEKLIKEIAEHYKIPKKAVTHENVVNYRNSLKKIHELSFENIWWRMWRLRYNRNAGKTKKNLRVNCVGD